MYKKLIILLLVDKYARPDPSLLVHSNVCDVDVITLFSLASVAKPSTVLLNISWASYKLQWLSGSNIISYVIQFLNRHNLLSRQCFKHNNKHLC